LLKFKEGKLPLNHLFSCLKTTLRSLWNWKLFGLVINILVLSANKIKIVLSLLYCSTSLHFKTLKSHTKTLKICPCMFQSPLKPSSGGPWPYFTALLSWNLSIYIHYKECRFVALCQFIPSVCVCGYLSGQNYVVESMT
jgi:hypothetical protein